MSSPPAAPADVEGVQRPSTLSVPGYHSSAGAEAVELAAMAGLDLDPWQQFVLTEALGERKDGKWAAFEVGVAVPRQNGKGALLEARELAGLFLLGEQFLVHSAHQFDTSLEAFRRLLFLIENTPDFDRKVQRVSRSHGEEGIELKGGRRIRFRTRTKGGGRGFSGDLLVLDEAMFLPESAHGALLPTLSARPNPQVWYTGSAVDEWVHEHGVVFARLRERGHRGDDPGLVWCEWAGEGADPSDVSEDAAGDPRTLARANPALGRRISSEHVERERASMDPRTFAVERLGVGAWPVTDRAGGWQVLDQETWEACIDTTSEIAGGVCVAFDVTPDRSRAAVGVAGAREDELEHVEVVEHRRGTGWVAPRVAQMLQRHDVSQVICDAGGPAASLLNAMADHDIDVRVVSAREYAQACGGFYDAATERRLRHLDDPDLSAALKGAAKRPLGEAWAWSRKTSSIDISPLVAVTLAQWGHAEADGPSVYEERGLLTV